MRMPANESRTFFYNITMTLKCTANFDAGGHVLVLLVFLLVLYSL